MNELDEVKRIGPPLPGHRTPYTRARDRRGRTDPPFRFPARAPAPRPQAESDWLTRAVEWLIVAGSCALIIGFLVGWPS